MKPLNPMSIHSTHMALSSVSNLHSTNISDGDNIHMMSLVDIELGPIISDDRFYGGY